MLSTWLDPRRASQPLWVSYFENGLPTVCVNSLRRFSRLPALGLSEQQTYCSDQALENLDHFICGMVGRLSESSIGRSFRSKAFVSLLCEIAFDASVRTNATKRCLSILRSILILSKNFNQTSPRLPEMLTLFVGDECKPIFSHFSSVLQGSTLSLIQEITNIISLLIELRFRSIIESIYRAGLIDAALEASLRKKSNATVLHSAGSLLFDEFVYWSKDHIDITIEWLKRSQFLSNAIADVQRQQDLRPADCDANHPYLLKIILRLSDMMAAYDNVYDAMKQYMTVFPPLVMHAALGLKERANWEVESPRKRSRAPSSDAAAMIIEEFLEEEYEKSIRAAAEEGEDPAWVDDDDEGNEEDEAVFVPPAQLFP